MTYIFPSELRNWLANALPEETASYGTEPQLAHTYLPAAHVKALHPNNMLVEGIRGSGKSFWWSALQSAELRASIGKQVGIGSGTHVSIGFGQISNPNLYPGKDTLNDLFVKRRLEPRKIWLTVVFRQVASTVVPAEFKAQKDWLSRVKWVCAHPEIVEQVLYKLDQELEQSKQYHLVLFDALDRLSDEWVPMNHLVRGLLQLVLDFRSFRRFRLKVFARPDQLEDSTVKSFPDASKILSQKVCLDWPRQELYGLLWQYLANETASGKAFRQGCKQLVPNAVWRQQGEVWVVPELLRADEDCQRTIFHAMTGPWMGNDHRRGFPYLWLTGHLSDARGQVSPRSFLQALRKAQEDKVRPGYEYPLHYENIKVGVQEASKIRVRELQEDYPWVENLFKPLLGLVVPCPDFEIAELWERFRTLDRLEFNTLIDTVKLPPAHLSSGPSGVITDLIELGLFERLRDGRINLPDVYRVGYGLGRRGGVKPIKKL